MALEPSVSPEPSSGRVSPISRKWRSQLNSDEPSQKDKAFRRYASGVDRSLSLFETALQEWADYISFLSRLLKSLQAHPSTTVSIPSKAIVAKRLAQCLNPSLPSGVHQKALEVYAFIFSMIGKDVLSRDLPLWLPGLSSTLSFASLSVRTLFIELFENYLVVLDSRSLRPALKAIILALLPGLEEESSEDFERTLSLLDGFKKAVRPPESQDIGQNHNSGDDYFWQCFFLAAITSNNRRLGALAYLTRSLPRLGELMNSDNRPGKDGLETDLVRLSELVTSPEPGLLLRCFAAGLADEQLLTQRGFLDLLVTHLPLHSQVLQKKVKSEDLELLVTAAAGVVSRREMSLNRRLWTWLLGPEHSSQDGDVPESPNIVGGDHLGPPVSLRTRYFEDFGLQPLTQALLKLIANDQSNATERARPFRICLSLMDKWEIGGLIVPDIFLPVVDSVRRYKDQAATKADFSEVLRSASVFFDGVESGLIWGEIVGLISHAISVGKVPMEEKIDKLSLVNFIIANFNVREEEMLLIHAPLTTLIILAMLEDSKAKAHQQSSDTGTPEQVSKLALSIATNLVELIPERAFQQRPSTLESTAMAVDETKLHYLANSDILQKIRTFYNQDHGNLELYSPPYSSRKISQLLLREATSITCQSLTDPAPIADTGLKTRLLIIMLTKFPRVTSFDFSKLLFSIQSKLKTSSIPFSTLSSLMSLATNLYSTSYISSLELSELVEPLVRHLWEFLSPAHPKYHVEAVRCLWQLQMALSLSNHEVEAAICTLMVEHDVTGTFAIRAADSGKKFAILWTHTLQDIAHQDRRASKASHVETKGQKLLLGTNDFEVMLARPLFLLLDSLLDDRTQLFMTMRTWLQNLVGIEKLLHLFVIKFTGYPFLQQLPRLEGDSASIHRGTFVSDDDLNQCLYYLRMFSNVLRWSSDSIWTTMATVSISSNYTGHTQITGQDGDVTFLEFFLHVCLRAISGGHDQKNIKLDPRVSQFYRAALNTLHQILLSQYSLSLAGLNLEIILIDRLFQSLDESDSFIQVLLLDVVFAALKLQNAARPAPPPLSPTSELKRSMTQDTPHNLRLSIATDRTDQHIPQFLTPPASLVKCLQAGISAPNSRSVLESWVSFMTECMPFYSETLFQILIPLVETLCSQVASTFRDLQVTFKTSGSIPEGMVTPESTLISLLNGLEYLLAKAHDRLLQDESKTPAVKSPEQPQSFFGNMTSGLFASETPQSRSATANNRLTVLLSFQDVVRICFMIWSWGGDDLSVQDTESSSSFTYTSLRMRNRARRLLEHLFAAEALECLETVVELWQKSSETQGDQCHQAVINLLHVLDGSRPKHTIPAIFNAIYSRTNPAALDPSRKSTLTSTLSDTDLVVFLVEYARSLEDDAMDEIWIDCMTFLKDILANPFPHRQTLPRLLEFAAILGEKVDNTNFGEQRRMRRDLADLFLRLLTALFTTKPTGFSENSVDNDERPGTLPSKLPRPDDVVSILATITPNLPKILVEPDRVLSAANTVSTNLIGPILKSKSFPENISENTLVLLYQLARLPQTQKSWKKDVGDAFNDPRFFGSSVDLVHSGWLPLLKQWSLSDKDRMPELLSRLLPPTTAGIVFGVGATSARLEADRKTQLNLRRIAILILSSMTDNFIADLPVIQEKIVELFASTITSSPSSTTRADIYLLLRALILKTSVVHLATLWPIINTELHAVLSSTVAPDHSVAAETYNNNSILQACKLLDTLLCIAPDDFQLHEWLFITDTIDAVYRPSDFEPIALADELSEELGVTASGSAIQTESLAMQAANSSSRTPLLGPGKISDAGVWERKDELVGKVLRPFFSQLSIFTFESTYSMGVPDWEACRTSLLGDLFDERSIVKTV